MVRTNSVAFCLSVVIGVVLWSPSASAQQATASGIAGVVKDTSGAVLPGVTVEAASPVLIEKVRSVTDSRVVASCSGQHLSSPSTAASTLQQDGIELPAGFTATVNAG
jgi:hypothetical protein